MQIRLYRHGRTAGNLHSAYIGVTDEPLCEVGRDELEPLDAGVSLVYVTSRRRTAETASILFPLAEQVPVDGLSEMDFGKFEAKDWSELADDIDYRKWVEGDCEGICPGGEDRATFQKRCLEAFIPLVDEALAAGRETMVFVVHGGTIMSLLDAFAVPHHDYFEWRTRPGGHWVLETDPSRWARHEMTVLDGSGALAPEEDGAS